MIEFHTVTLHGNRCAFLAAFFRR